MREILFKAKRTDTKDWVEGWYCKYPFSRWPLKPCIIPSAEAEDGEHMHIEVDPETVGQYTGMNDKNGKKIFEGDKIRFVTWEKDVMERAVCWDQEHGRFCVWLNGAVTVGVNRYLSDDIEVIGNIHDKEDSYDLR